MNNLDLKPNSGEKKNRKRVGRGTGNGMGKTSGKGHKGQNSRSGGGVPAWFEGGQMPLYRRLPKKGFKNLNKVFFNIVNVMDLNGFKDGSEVNAEILAEKGMIKSNGAPVKILGDGEMTVKSLKIEVNKVSAKAKEKLEAAGCSIELI